MPMGGKEKERTCDYKPSIASFVTSIHSQYCVNALRISTSEKTLKW